ncbi:hypothetical protein [Allokutzneria albata]|uniref:N-acetyltransferase domain-containing protein n=1 Tax=Allokutzneria albata TaxID=211114 RepID=A0A1G9TST4_ALLAB|nr:hypothetical protein [Allokutzneria albata]SDM50790.1 hypothetical protein SAMN04489726_1977 [Allokutzneria albata]
MLREKDLFDRSAAALDALDPLIAVYRKQDRELLLRVANSLPRRNDVLEMRRRHYESMLHRLGVAVWDAYDERAAQFLCLERKAKAPGAELPVGSMRIVPNTPVWGELRDDFGELRELLPEEAAPGGGFTVVGREVVIPSHRSLGVSAALVHASLTWWAARTRARRLVLTSLASASSAARFFGAQPVTEPLPLGPGRVPVIVMTVELDTARERAESWLRGRGWVIHHGGRPAWIEAEGEWLPSWTRCPTPSPELS